MAEKFTCPFCGANITLQSLKAGHCDCGAIIEENTAGEICFYPPNDSFSKGSDDDTGIDLGTNNVTAGEAPKKKKKALPAVIISLILVIGIGVMAVIFGGDFLKLPDSGPIDTATSTGTSETPPIENEGFENLVFEEADGYIKITGYTGDATEFVIPEEINGMSVVSIGENAFYNCKFIESVVIPDSVQSIGNDAFHGCTALKSVILPVGLATIGHGTFCECTSLTSVVLPLELTAIGDMAFSGCSSLEDIEIPDSVASIGGGVFYGCRSLETVTIPQNVTNISWNAFYGCDILTIYCEASEQPSGWDSDWNPDNRPVVWGYKVSEGLEYEISADGEYYIVKGEGTCLDTDIIIPLEYNGLPVKEIGSEAFYNCSSLTSIVIPESVASIGDGAFSGCTSLKSVNIPEGVTTIEGGTFSGCTSLESIVIPKGVTSIGASAFWRCTQLTSIELPEGVTSIGNGAFDQCTSLDSVILSKGVTSIGIEAFSNCESLTSVVLPETLTTIGDSAFYGCSLLSSIIIPDTVTVIGDGAFNGCSSLTIYAEAASKPDGWTEFWNPNSRPVTWGYSAPQADAQ